MASAALEAAFPIISIPQEIFDTNLVEKVPLPMISTAPEAASPTTSAPSPMPSTTIGATQKARNFFIDNAKF